eukprot:scaffold78511_cov48-Phaeocystis_antarctica.AAC.2
MHTHRPRPSEYSHTRAAALARASRLPPPPPPAALRAVAWPVSLAGPPEAASALARGPGCPKLRPASANQPDGPRWSYRACFLHGAVRSPRARGAAPWTGGAPSACGAPAGPPPLPPSGSWRQAVPAQQAVLVFRQCWSSSCHCRARMRLALRVDLRRTIRRRSRTTPTLRRPSWPVTMVMSGKCEKPVERPRGISRRRMGARWTS